MSQLPLFTRLFVLAAAANLLLSLAGFLFVHLPGFLQQLGAGEAQIGRIMAAQALGSLLAWPLVGYVMDVRGRRVVILTGASLFVAVIALYLYIDSLGPFIYFVRALEGAAHTMWYTALFTYAADLVPVPRRTEGLAIFGISGLVTIGLGAQFGDAILTYADYRELFLGALVLAAIGSLVALPLRDVRLAHDDDVHASRGVLALATQLNLVPVWCAAASFFISLGALFIFMKTFVSTADVGSVGGFFTAYTAIAVALRVFLGRLPDRFGTRRTLGFAMLCCAAGAILLSVADNRALVLIAGLLCGAGHGYTYPVLFSLVVERATTQARGSAMAFYTTIDLLSPLVAGPVFGYLIEAAGYGYAFASLALLLAIGVGLFYGLDRRLTARGAH
jgi:MFS family permease